MAAIKIINGTSTDSESNIYYQNGEFQGSSSAFNYFVTELVGTGFLRPSHILICDNATIHFIAENCNLAEILWELYLILVLNLPPYSPELTLLNLCFNY